MNFTDINKLFMKLYKEKFGIIDIKEADFIPPYPRDFLNYVSLVKLSDTGVWGKPSLGSKEKGERITKILVEKSIEYMDKVFNTMDDKAW